MDKVDEFLKNHRMLPQDICPSDEAVKMISEMRRGLKGEVCSLPMIPTYLKTGKIGSGCAAVIDAGGTNFRSALVTFTENGYKTEYLTKKKMPGIGEAVEWEQFISFAADSIMPLMEYTDCIGFCFSYSADITPEIDGIVRSIDKEVVINNSAGKPVGSSLKEELERRGVHGKKIVVLNDTAAVLLGGASMLDNSLYDGFIGQVSGTGTNTCCSVAAKDIVKLGLSGDECMIINTESGMYDGIAMGEFDRILDAGSLNPGSKHFEKMTAGVYLGTLCSLMLAAGCKEGFISENTLETLQNAGEIDGAVIDAWSMGENLSGISSEDRPFVQGISRALFERSARCMCANLAALIMLTGKGKNGDRPVCVCAEGSLVQKSRIYRPELERLMEEHIGGILGLHAVLVPVEESTLPGAAAAAILN